MFTQEQLDRVLGADLIDQHGDRVGGVGTVFFDDVTNEASWITVNTGFFGMNESFVPLQGASFEGDDVRVAFDKEFIKDAPNVDVDHGHLDRAQEEELYRYYGLDYGTGRMGDDATISDHLRSDRRGDGGLLGDDRDLDRDRLAGQERLAGEERLAGHGDPAGMAGQDRFDREHDLEARERDLRDREAGLREHEDGLRDREHEFVDREHDLRDRDALRDDTGRGLRLRKWNRDGDVR